jgi:hypothetical protein
MKTIIAPTILTLLVFAQSAYAETWYQIESSIESRIAKLVHYVDRDAIVVVKGQLKNDTIALPGVTSKDVNISAFAYMREFKAHDLSAIQITIYSKESQFPTWIQDEIEKIGRVSGVKTSIDIVQRDVQVMDANTLDGVTKSFERTEKNITQFFEKVQVFVFSGAAFLLVLMGAFVALIAHVIKKNIGYQLQGLREIHEDTAGGSNAMMSAGSSANALADQSSAANVSAKSIEDSQGTLAQALRSLSPESSVALMADAYWSQEDEYASWIWTHFSQSQKRLLLDTWEPGFAYAEYLCSVTPMPRNYHLHPIYEQASELNMTSNIDLVELLKSREDMWFNISPLRREHLTMDFNLLLSTQRLEGQRGNGERSRSGGVKKDYPKSHVRKLNLGLKKIELSEKEEALLPSLSANLTMEQKRQFPSWVWLNKHSDEYCKDLLSKYSAQELASCWVGPADVMTRMSNLMPERKRKIVLSISQNGEPRRLTPTLVSISQTALNHKTELFSESDAKAA